MESPNQSYDNDSVLDSSESRNAEEWKEEEEAKPQIAKRDSTHVLLSMLVVTTTIAITAGIVIALTYAFLSHDEKEDFQHGFVQQANVVIESSTYHATQVLESLEAMSSGITSFATFTGQELGYQWPCMTIPHFEKRGHRARKAAFLEMISFSPLVLAHDTKKWEDYSSSANTTWMKDGKASSFRPEVHGKMHGETHSLEGLLYLPAWQMAPPAHDASLVNFNLLSEDLYYETFEAMHMTKLPTLSGIVKDGFVFQKYFDPIAHDQHHNHHAMHLGHSAGGDQKVGLYDQGKDSSHIHMDHMSGDVSLPPPTASSHEHHSQTMNDGEAGTQHVHHGMDMDMTMAPSHTPSSSNIHHGHVRRAAEGSSHSGHSMHEMGHSGSGDTFDSPSSSNGSWAMSRPHSIVMSPIYDSFDEHNRTLAGVLHGILAWEFYLTDLLPPGITGIIVVLQDTCGSSKTFELMGPHAEFLGDGDLHDMQYDEMAQIVDLGTIFLAGHDSVVDGQCMYSLAIYPSKTFEAEYASDSTTQFVGLLAGIFGALALFFFIFVWFVQRRQHKVMTIATRTTSIVAQLFPADVRDRIMQEAEAQAQRQTEQGKNEVSADDQSNLKSLLNAEAKSVPFSSSDSKLMKPGEQTCLKTGQLSGGIKILEDAPIANNYPDTTVFFADLVGFTKWSSSRTPQEVFVLLETLYGEFDVICRRRNVFKVETIGDCYVAVVGLPKPRRDHAVAMSRFAWDCLRKSSLVFNALSDRLGPDTRDLNLRTGLHSGAVTAGVLRGEKGRFQLFGDTVNTAARMESNGKPGSIHCSHTTKELLVQAGKSEWVTERPDKIVAKGKGEMRTYWLTVKSTGSSHYSGATGSTDSTEEFTVPPFGSLRQAEAEPKAGTRVVDC